MYGNGRREHRSCTENNALARLANKSPGHNKWLSRVLMSTTMTQVMQVHSGHMERSVEAEHLPCWKELKSGGNNSQRRQTSRSKDPGKCRWL